VRAAALTSGRWGLSPAEWATSVFAYRVSGAMNARWGHPYLARGVVGDLLGLAVLAVAGRALGARPRHEALLCLVAIGAVLLADPDWPLAVDDRTWWLLLAAGLAGYLAVRRGLTAG
jgi:hypothetical protein